MTLADMYAGAGVDLTADYSWTGAHDWGKTLTSGGTDDKLIDLAATLNDSGAAGGSDVFRLIKGNITETDVTGWDDVYLLDLQVGGTSQVHIETNGITSGAGFELADRTALGGAAVTSGLVMNSSEMYVNVAGSTSLKLGSTYARVNGDLYIGGSGADVILYRDAAETLALRRTTTAQAFRVYATWTNASNGDWLQFTKSAGGDAIISTEANGTGTAGDVVIPDGVAVSNSAEGNIGKITRRTSRETHTLSLATTSDTTTISVPLAAGLIGVSMCVDTAVTNDGDNTWTAAFITGSTTQILEDSTGASIHAAAQNTKVNFNIVPAEKTTGVAEIQFTPQSGSFTAGIIEIVCYYESLTSLANV